jgi:hypothetical protein
MSKPTVRIKNWSLIHGGMADWLEGEVEDHPRFNAGTRVHTSKIISTKDDHAETLNTIYILVGPEVK